MKHRTVVEEQRSGAHWIVVGALLVVAAFLMWWLVESTNREGEHDAQLLPFFALIAACAEGTTMIHEWVYENRAIYLTELTKVGAKVQLLDPHRVLIEGPTRWRAAEVICPPALRPGVVVLLAMLAAPGTSVLRNVYVINRGYEDLAERLNLLGANIEPFRDI